MCSEESTHDVEDALDAVMQVPGSSLFLRSIELLHML